MNDTPFSRGRDMGICAAIGTDLGVLRNSLAFLDRIAAGTDCPNDVRHFVFGTVHGAADTITGTVGNRGVLDAANIVAGFILANN